MIKYCVFGCIITILFNLHSMQQEPPRKSPKMALDFILNQYDSAQPAPTVIIHLKRSHTCPYCMFNFERRHQLEQHVIDIHKKWRCTECDYQTPNLRSLRAHLHTHHRYSMGCPTCSESSLIRALFTSKLCAKHREEDRARRIIVIPGAQQR